MLEPEATIDSIAYDLHQPVEPTVEMSLRRSQLVRKLACQLIMCTCISNFKIGQVNDPLLIKRYNLYNKIASLSL